MRFAIEILAVLTFAAIDTLLACLRAAVRWVLAPQSGRTAPRFVPIEQRAWWTDLPLSVQFYRGVQRAKWNPEGAESPPVHWKGVQCMKDPFDFTLYPLLLWELRPATIIELGSNAGGSAVWLADLAVMMELETRVFSFDIDPARIRGAHARVTFACADSDDVSTFPLETLKQLPHPWLVLEDAHQNVCEVLRFFDALLVPGDYLVVEDLLSLRKYREFRRFALAAGERYRVDRRFTDLFGYNVTWNLNGYLKRV